MKIFVESNCFFCGREIEYRNLFFGLCKKCIDDVKYIDLSNACSKCGLPNAKYDCWFCKASKLEFDKNISLYTYDGIIKKLVYDIKFNNEKWKTKIINSLTKGLILDKLFGEKIDLVVPVPPSFTSIIKRGFDFTKLVFKPIANNNKKKIVSVLGRKISLLQQKKLSKVERLEFVKNQFFVRKSIDLNNKIVLLVDDIFTTGSTLNACSDILKKMGASKVFSLTLVRVVEEL